MRELIFIYLLIIFSSNVFAKDTTIKARGSFYGQSIDNKQTQARLGGIEVDFIITHTLPYSLEAYLDVGAQFEYGSNSSLFISEFEPGQELILNEGVIRFNPISFFEFKAGGINQGQNHSPLFLDSVAFLAAQEQLTLGPENFSFYLRAQQAIPNNQSLSARVGNVEEGTPSFILNTLGLHFNNSLFDWKLEASQYAFSALSNGVAHRSRFLGNQVDGIGEDAAYFYFKYRGYNLFTQLSTTIADSIDFLFYGHYLYNDKAPNSRNIGYLGHLELGMNKKNVFAEFFHNESDTTVAYYNNKYYGHNNKEGFSIGFNLGFPKENMDLKLQYINSQMIQFNIYQSDSQVFLFNLQRDFDIL